MALKSEKLEMLDLHVFSRDSSIAKIVEMSHATVQGMITKLKYEERLKNKEINFSFFSLLFTLPQYRPYNPRIYNTIPRESDACRGSNIIFSMVATFCGPQH